MKEPIVSIKQLTKTFQTKENTVTALEQVDLSVEEGDFVSIIGILSFWECFSWEY